MQNHKLIPGTKWGVCMQNHKLIPGTKWVMCMQNHKLIPGIKWVGGTLCHQPFNSYQTH